MDEISSIGNQDINAIEELYEKYLNQADSVDKSWQQFFAGFELARKSFPQKPSPKQSEYIDKEFSILNLIHGYRQRGHLFTKTNPKVRRRLMRPSDPFMPICYRWNQRWMTSTKPNYTN